MTPRKTSAEISAIIVSQLETSLSTTIPLLPKSFNRVLAKVLGAVFVLLYEHIGFVQLQMFVKTATNEEININGTLLRPLTELGRLVGIKQDQGQAAKLQISIPVLTTGGTLTSGTMLLNSSTGLTYVLLGNVSLSSSTVTGSVRATKNGTIGNMDNGAKLQFISAPPEISKTATVTATTTEGVEEEDVEDFRQRILDRWAARPQGGAYADYYDWCMAVTGVKNCYPYSGWDIAGLPYSGSGTVVIFIESKTDPDGVPTVGDALLTAVLQAIQFNETGLANRRPINAFTDTSLVRPIIRYTVNLTITGLSVDGDLIMEARAAINAGMTEFYLDREPFILGLMVPPRKDMVSLAESAGTAARIAAAYGGFFSAISGTINGNDLDPYYILQEGEKVKLGTITWN